MNGRIKSKCVSAFWSNQIKDNQAICQMKVELDVINSEALVQLPNKGKKIPGHSQASGEAQSLCPPAAEVKPASKSQFYQ